MPLAGLKARNSCSLVSIRGFMLPRLPIVAGVQVAGAIQNLFCSALELALEFARHSLPCKLRIQNRRAHKKSGQDHFQYGAVASAKSAQFVRERTELACNRSKLACSPAGIANLGATAHSCAIRETKNA